MYQNRFMKIANKVLFIVAVCFIAGSAIAQKGWRLGVGLNPGISTTEYYGFVLGADARLQTNIGKGNSVIITSGVTNFFKTVKSSSYTVIPFKIGIKSFLGSNAYAAIEAGAGVGLTSNTGTGFVWSPSVGLAFSKLDVSLKYEDFIKYSSTKQVALRFAYGFKL
jgi:hypothetical protein